MSLSKIGKRTVATAVATTTVSEITRIMEELSVGSVVIVAGRKPIGIVTDRDLALRVLRRGLDPAKLPVEEVMTHDPICVAEECDVTDAAAQLRAKEVRRLPIVDGNGDLVGLVTLDDLLHQIGREIAALSGAIATYPVPHFGG